MNVRLEQIRARRARLLDEAASQRRLFAHAYGYWRTPLGYADLGISVARALGRKPLLLTFISTGLLGIKGRRVGTWATRLWSLWTVLRLAREWHMGQPCRCRSTFMRQA